MKKLLSFLIIIIVLSSCHRNKSIEGEKIIENKTWHINISSTNLSEDASVLSSQDDELILLVYSKIENTLPAQLVKETFILKDKSKTLSFPLRAKRLSDEKVIVVLIEVDSKHTIDQIEPIVRINLQKLLDNFYQEDKNPTRELLDDDDLLGIEKISLNDLKLGKAILFEGINLFDAYKYKIVLSENALNK